MGPGATDTSVRVVVWAKRPPGVTPGDIDRAPPHAADLRDRLQLAYPGRDARYYFPDGFIVITPESPPAKRELLEFLALDATDETDAEVLVRELRTRGDVRSVYAESGPQPPPTGPTSAPRTLPPFQGGPPKLQPYLDAAPTGIDARWVWANVLNGVHVTFVDLEAGWDLDHPELVAKNIGVAWGLPSTIASDTQHGACVLGIVLAANDGAGITGIAYDAPAKVVARRSATTGIIERNQAIVIATDMMTKGDVLLIEDQVQCKCSSHKAPIEVEALSFKAIQAAVQAEIVVVEAGGNGQKNLDQCHGSSLNFTMAHGGYDTDSGAILVAGASAACPRVVAGGSNHGARIDCHAWGETITTCDNYVLNDPDPYIDNFGGASGAAAIVAGAALLLQYFAKSTGQPLTPDVVRTRLSDPNLNTLSSGYPADGLGVMPNLRTVIGGGTPAQCAGVERRQSGLLVSTPGGSGPGGGTQSTAETPSPSPSSTP